MKYLLLLLLLSSCARQTWFPPMAPRADTTVLAGWPAAGKVKFTGTVIIQAGQGNQASVDDNRKAGQRQGSAATAPAAHASTTVTPPARLPWWAWAVGLGVVAGAGLYIFRHQLAEWVVKLIL